MGSAFDDDLLLIYTDFEMSQYIDSSSKLPRYPNIALLSSKYLAKGYHWEDEVADETSAATLGSSLGARAPSTRRVVQIENGYYCIMDRISGRTLEAVWPELGWWTSFRLALQLRRVIRRFRGVESSHAGSLTTGKCRSFYLDDTFGLPNDANVVQVSSFLNFWINFISIGREISKTPSEHSTCLNPVFPSIQPFVFTHHDLAPRNMMVDAESQLLLIDWEHAGFYPKCFEYAGMHNFICADWGRFARWRWRCFTWVAAGFYGKFAGYLESVRAKIYEISDRRVDLNMKAKGYAAVARRPDSDVGSAAVVTHGQPHDSTATDGHMEGSTATKEGLRQRAAIHVQPLSLFSSTGRKLSRSSRWVSLPTLPRANKCFPEPGPARCYVSS